MAQRRYDNISAGQSARQHNGDVVNNNRYYYGLRSRRSDETLREDQRNLRLLRAAAEGQLHRIQHLIRLGADVDFSDESDFTALHHAVLSGFEDCVQELIRLGSDVNAMTPDGAPLNLAIQKERRHVISILIGARADKARALSFAAEQGGSVGGQSLLFDGPIIVAMAEVISSPNPFVEDAAEEDRPPFSVTAENTQGKQEDSTNASDERNDFKHLRDPNKDTIPGNRKVFLPDWQNHESVKPQECDGERQGANTGSEEGNPGRMGSMALLQHFWKHRK